MIWIYILIIFFIGIITGSFITLWSNRNLRNQRHLKNELEKNKIKLNEYKKELIHHFTSTEKLLNNMADNYKELYQHILNGVNTLLPENKLKNNIFQKKITNKEKNKEKSSNDIQPRDYSENINNVLENKNIYNE